METQKSIRNQIILCLIVLCCSDKPLYELRLAFIRIFLIKKTNKKNCSVQAIHIVTQLFASKFCHLCCWKWAWCCYREMRNYVIIIRHNIPFAEKCFLLIKQRNYLVFVRISISLSFPFFLSQNRTYSLTEMFQNTSPWFIVYFCIQRIFFSFS